MSGGYWIQVRVYVQMMAESWSFAATESFTTESLNGIELLNSPWEVYYDTTRIYTGGSTYGYFDYGDSALANSRISGFKWTGY